MLVLSFVGVMIMRRAFGKIEFLSNSSARLIIPADVVAASGFPFKDGEYVKIEIKGGGLTLRAVEWWEVVDWRTIPEAFQHLPEDVKEKVKAAGLI